MKLSLLVSISTFPLLCQSLAVYSEFARIDPSGEVTAPARPREILSPAVVRNGFTSFQVVVRVPKDTTYWLDIGQNPPHAAKITLLRPVGDYMEPVALPYQGVSTQTFLLDVWIDSNISQRRIKVEPQLNADLGEDDLGLITYPMEFRVMNTRIPDVAYRKAWYMETLLCGPDARPELDDSPIQPFHSRNERQDIALAENAPKAELLRLAGGCGNSHTADPEWYLRLRDYLLRMP